MILPVLAIVSGTLAILIALFVAGLARSVLSEIPEDTGALAGQGKPARGPLAMLSRLWSWLNRSPPLLDYRRDKRGRFRKVRRG